MDYKDTLLEIDNLRVNFYTYQGIVKALDGINLTINKAETLGLVGETGCGKSVTASAITRLILSPPGKIEDGSVYFLEPADVRARRKAYEAEYQAQFDKLSESDKKKAQATYGPRATGFKKKVKPPTQEEIQETIASTRAPLRLTSIYMEKKAAKIPKTERTTQEALRRAYNLLSKNDEYMQMIRGKFISMIFQEPASALNPVFTAGDQIAEVILLHRKQELSKRIIKRLNGELALMGHQDWPRKITVPAKICGKCGQANQAAATKCVKCESEFIGKAKKAKDDVLVCSNCGSPVKDSEVQCKKCNVKFLTKPPEKIQNPTEIEESRKPFLRCSVCGITVKEQDIKCPQCNSIFAVKRRPKKNAVKIKTCVKCGTSISMEDEKCPCCGCNEFLELKKGLFVRRGSSSASIHRVEYRCSICDNKINKRDEWCDQCGNQFFGPISWRIRPVFLRSYKKIFQIIEKNPKSNYIRTMGKIPLLNRFSKELYHEAFRDAVRMIEIVRIPDPKEVAHRYPHELSGGMQQRVMIAIALACNPKLLIADEPTTALDVTIQAQILKLMREMKEKFGSSILLITHNLGVVAEMCDRVGVMYAGTMAEIGDVRAIFKSPLHPYTMSLMKAVPSVHQDTERLFTIRGSVPNLVFPPTGCRFHPRCDFMKEYCSKMKPELVEIEKGHFVACHKASGAKGYV
jgi:oligopeptide/dipeptide ABC transporter ATP-binding protein